MIFSSFNHRSHGDGSELFNLRLDTEIANAPLLLGRETVFDLFDLKFVQAEERVEFEWRGEIG